MIFRLQLRRFVVARLRRRYLAFGLLLILFAQRAVNGQDGPEPDDAVQRRIAEISAMETPSADETAELVELKAAVAFRQEARAAAERAKALSEEAGAAADRLIGLNSELETARAGLASLVDLGLAPTPADATAKELEEVVASLEIRLGTEKTQWEARKTALGEAEREDRDRALRVNAAPGLLVEISRRSREVARLLGMLPSGNNASALIRARRASLDAEASALLARKAELDLLLSGGIPLPELQRTVVALEGVRAQQARRIVDALQKEIEDRRTQIAALRAREAEAAMHVGESEHDVIRGILERNLALAEELESGVARPRRDRTARMQGVVELREEWRRDFRKLQVQVDQIGLDSVIGLRLRNVRTQLTALRHQRRVAEEVRREYEHAYSRSVELDEETIEDPRREAERLLAQSGAAVSEEERERILQSATEALRAQQEHVTRLRDGYVAYAEKVLLPLHLAESELADFADRAYRYVEQRFLWVRSTDPVGLQNVADFGRSVFWLIDVRNWVEVGSVALERVKQRPGLSLLSFVPFLALLVLRRRMRRHLEAAAENLGHAPVDRFPATLRATVATLLPALTWPALLWALSLLLEGGGETGFAAATSLGLSRAALLLLVYSLVWNLCHPGWLGDLHFAWRPENMELVRRNLGWLIPVSVTLSSLVALTGSGRFPVQHDSLGRLSYCVSCFALVFFAWRIFHPERGVLRSVLAERRGGWADRLRMVWFPALLLVPLSLVPLACLGYFRTARTCSDRQIASACLILTALLVSSLLSRWLQLVQRRERAEGESRGTPTAPDAMTEPGEHGPVEPPPPDEIVLGSEEVGAHMQRLVRMGVAVFLIVGLFTIWEEVLPALGMLDEVLLWAPRGAALAIDGSGVLPEGAVSAADVGLGILILILTFVVSRSTPGLLELLLLRHLPLSPGGRFTVRTLIRYAVVIVGIILAFDMVGVGWAKVQWLAAAVSVGLGFGLQEIFANFVSGLIILTERPVRIGDTVTVGDVSGTVTRIQMRATTVTSWDEKELIIPNKSFVTGQITNWTLSEALLRLTLPVGIAYGSDTVTAKRLLVEVARENPSVLGNPPSVALFTGFGDSALQFELRAYIEAVPRFAVIRDELYMAIDQAFRGAGIVIAFPQRDVHIRPSDVVDPRPGEPEETGSVEGHDGDRRR